jgi:hypothetical protein
VKTLWNLLTVGPELIQLLATVIEIVQRAETVQAKKIALGNLNLAIQTAHDEKDTSLLDSFFNGRAPERMRNDGDPVG